ncbi:MAG TPA: hypothetical protein VI932_07445 [Bacteroidota bacterium]|nr:hypothetical protein [Bacteroidota bacterium]
MTKRMHGRGSIAFPIDPIVTEGPVPRDPGNVRVMLKEIHRLENKLRHQKGDITTLRQLLISHNSEEHWEVPG